MPNSKTYHHGDLRNALLKEAARELESSGPDGISLRSLARTLGVSHAAPGHHFTDRRALLAEIAADGFADLSDRLEAAVEEAQANGAGGDGYHVLYEAGLAYVDVALEHPQRFKLMFSCGFLNPAQLNSEDCPARLRTESSRAYKALLRVARGHELSEHELNTIEHEDYEIQVPELATWALVHGIATLYIDGALGLGDDPLAFRKLVAAMLAELSGKGPGAIWQTKPA